MKEYKITKEGYERLLKDLEYLMNEKRKDIASRLKEAKNTGGNLSENSEYEFVKNEQAFTEGRIEQINEILKNYKIVDKNTKKEKVDIGSSVVLRDMVANKNIKYKIVSSIESEPENGKISDESPLGRSLLGKKIKDEVNVRTPKKTLNLKIIDII